MPRTLGLIVVAAGASRRMEGLDKIWEPLGAHPIVWFALAELTPLATAVVVVVREDQMTRARRELVEPFDSLHAGQTVRSLEIVSGGIERQESVARGLAALPRVDHVAVHDAARPFARAQMLRAGANLLERFDGAIPVEPLHDTIKRVDSAGNVVATVDRSMLRAAQTPQLFRREALETAHEAARHAGRMATDDAGLLEDAGYRVATFSGLRMNFKITTAYDLQLARLLVEHGSTPPPEPTN